MVYILDRQPEIYEALNASGIQSEYFSAAETFFTACKERPPRLVLVRLLTARTAAFMQIMKPERGGLQPPVLVVCEEDTPLSRAAALDLGADDAVSVPFDMNELLSRVRCALRRAERRPVFCIEYEGIVMDDERRRVTIDGKPQPLTYTEYEILKLLLRDVGRVQSRASILERVWGPSDIGETRAVDMHIAALRRKLGKRGGLIHTMRGSGYMLLGSRA